MPAEIEIRADARLARIKGLGPDGRVAYFELDNGSSGTVRSTEPLNLELGDVIMIWAAENRFEKAPGSLWPDEEDRVAVVRLRLDDITIVEEGTRWRHIDTTDTPTYAAGNTVLMNSKGVRRVLAPRPIRFLDSGAPDTSAETFKVTDPLTLTFDDVGGMQKVVERAKELIELPLLKAQQLREIGARPIKGVLFTGPPGTGKTMLARIISSRSGATFYKVSGPEIVSKWYGESEAILRRIFEDAARQERAIIFFDEIDSVASRRDGDSHEASQRFVAQLLALMDGFGAAENVVIIAATNRPEALDPALRRPGRFDWEVAFDLPDDGEREEILIKAARRLRAIPNLPHSEVACATKGWSGAELAAIWTEAALRAAADDRSVIFEEDYRDGYARVASQRRAKGHKR